MKHVHIMSAAAVLLALGACDRVSGTPAGNVAVQLATASSAGGASGDASPADGLQLAGTNGTLSLTDLRLIVSRVKLDGDEHGCEKEHNDRHNCLDFRLPPFLAQVPLSSGAITIAAGAADPGTYTEVELRVKNLDVDDDDDEDDMDDDEDHGDHASFTKVLAEARLAFPDWPNRASMVATGTFTPTGAGQVAKTFTVYFRAELKLEMPLDPPLVVTASGASRTVTVTIRSDAWFKGADGRVADLSAFDFPKTGKVVEFKPEAKKGFRAKHDD